jgi:hypothetical protein
MHRRGLGFVDDVDVHCFVVFLSHDMYQHASLVKCLVDVVVFEIWLLIDVCDETEIEMEIC